MMPTHRSFVAIVLGLALAAPAHAGALPRAPGPILVLSSAEPDHGGWGSVMFDPALRIDPRKLPGGPARDYTVLPGGGMDSVSAVIAEAERAGAAACDTLPHFAGRPQVWEAAWYAVATDGGFRLVRRTHVSIGALRCRALAHRVDPAGMAHTMVQAALEEIIRLGGPAYAMGPVPDHGGPSPEISRILDRASLVRDARNASPLRDWDSIALDLCMQQGRLGHAVRLSSTALPVTPGDACAARWIRVPPAALQKALLAFLPRGPIELAARRPHRRALRDGACGRYAITLWDASRQVPSLVDDAYLTPLEMDSLARDVADALPPDAARAVRAELGLTGPRLQPAPLAALRGVEAGADPVAIRLAPSEGGEFVAPILLAVEDIPDSVLAAATGYRAHGPDDEVSLVLGPHARIVSRATLHVVATVLARAAADDTTGLDPMAQYPAWPASWRATLLDRAGPAKLSARTPRTLSTRRIRARAQEWADHLPKDAPDETRRMLDDLVELGLPPARQFRAVGEDPPVPALPSIEEVRESLYVVGRTGGGEPGAAFLGVSFWFHGGPPHGFTTSARFVAGDRGAAPTGNVPDAITPLAEASLRGLLAEVLDNPDVSEGAHRAREEMPPGGPYLELRVLERRHAGNPPRLLYVAFLDGASGARAVELAARALAGSEPDAAAELRQHAADLRGPSHMQDSKQRGS